MRNARTCTLAACLIVLLTSAVFAGDGNRLTHLDSADPYYVSRDFPKLTTPQWVGEEGVDAVVVLAIDDMRDPSKYEAFLRPILQRLKQIDGRAAVSIMTCSVKPGESQLQSWLQEGLSLEVHTLDHPCPLLKDGNFAKALATVNGCIDLLNEIPGNRPCAYRMPCCDSLNTVSPRAFAEIFNRTTEKGNFLTIDSSVFNVMTVADRGLPPETVLDANGQSRFQKYLPADRTFVNTIENYPYPYVIGRLCWEFPCVVPSDWSAQHRHKPNNPQTVDDWKALLDATVAKQGVFNLVFHPHGWISAQQIVELIDHAASRYGTHVKFLTFREAQDRLDRYLLAGNPLRASDGGDNGVRLLDVNADGFQDVVIGNSRRQIMRIWSPSTAQWTEIDFPLRLVRDAKPGEQRDAGARFGVLTSDGFASVLVRNEEAAGVWTFDGTAWAPHNDWLDGLGVAGHPIHTSRNGRDTGVRLRDLDRDGICELIVAGPGQQAVFQFQRRYNSWALVPFTLPAETTIVRASGRDAGLRFVDFNADGYDDVLFSDEQRYSLHLFESARTGWSHRVLADERRDGDRVPMIVRGETDNGAWFHSGHLWVQNEDTASLRDLVDRRSFKELLVHPASLPNTGSIPVPRLRTQTSPTTPRPQDCCGGEDE